MFTGLVEELGTVQGLLSGADSARIIVGAEKVLEQVQLGDSIAVNGVCLTVVDFTSKTFSVDVMPETLKRTNLKELKRGNRINLERAMQLASRVGGHMVSGHIDGVGQILDRKQIDIAVVAKISVPSNILPFVIEKGSIAVDGISLTVLEVSDDWLTVSLIPHTAKATTLGFKQPGDSVNLEADLIGKYVWRLLSYRNLRNNQNKVSYELLKENGFI